MANKYVVHWDGVTTDYQYCGDGTASTPAASAGASGAWNDFWSILEGTAPAQGTLAAGDFVNIRAKDSGGGALSKTYSTSDILGNTSATEAAPVYWLLDGGAIWSGITGDLTISSTGSDNWALEQFNVVSGVAGQRNWKFVLPVISSKYFQIREGAAFVNGELDIRSSGAGVYILGSDLARLSNVLIQVGNYYAKLFATGNSGVFYLDNVDVHLTNSGETDPVVMPAAYGSKIIWDGGKIYGDGATSGLKLYGNAGSGSGAFLTNVEWPKTIDLTDCGHPFSAITGRFISKNADSLLGFVDFNPAFIADTRDDGYYPTLNSVLPLSTPEPVSLRLNPYYVTEKFKGEVVLSKLWTQTAAIKTITVEFLIEEDLPTPNNHNTWMEISYISNATGERISQSSRAIGSTTTLSTGSSGWSATTYGPALFDAYKIALTTSAAIKKDTVVQIKFFTIIGNSQVHTRVFFIDLDPAFT